LIEQAQRRRRRRWPLIVGALIVVVVVAIVGAVGWWFSAGAEYWARAHWQPPKEPLLSSMKVHPVPGWTTNISALGLPPGSKLTTGDAPWLPGPVIETPDHRALLLARSPDPAAPQWWLTGIDVRDGRALFRPVALNATAATPACFLNGAAVTCISDDYYTANAWVIDGQNGELTYNGPTNVRLITGELKAAQFGNYLVAATKGEGLYGVGPHGETTWFVPGAGVVADHIGDVGFQGGSREGLTTMFSLQDGRVLTPEFPEGADMQSSGDFDGGFAAEFSEHQGPSFIQFFDTVGRLTNRERIDGQRVGGTTGNVTAIVQNDGFGIYGPSGDKLLDVSGDPPHGMQLIGTTLWVGEKSLIDESHFQPYDLRTGDKGKPCPFNMINGYLGTDGSVFVRSSWNLKSDDLAQAYDLATCDKVWSIPRTVGSSGQVTRIGDTLIQLSNDGTELMSLVAPS
jgi:hypothetical protein